MLNAGTCLGMIAKFQIVKVEKEKKFHLYIELLNDLWDIRKFLLLQLRSFRLILKDSQGLLKMHLKYSDCESKI